MSALKTMQVVVDDNPLNGVGGVRLHGQIADTRVSSGLREIVVNGVLEGTASTLDGLKAALLDTFITIGKRVFIKTDSTSVDNYADVYAGDGRTVDLQTSISQDPTRIATATSWPFLFSVFASEVIPSAFAGGGTGPDAFKGQSGDFRLTTSFDEANRETRALMITFGTLLIKDEFGNFPFTAVTDVGGFAVLDFGNGVLPGGAVASNTIFVTGSALYNGPHEVSSVVPATGAVTLTTAFLGDDSGDADIGQETLPADALEAARPALFSLLGIESDGSRDSTTGLSKAGESQAAENDLLSVVMSSIFSERDYGDEIRNWKIAFEEVEAEDWPDDPDAGDPPLIVDTIVTFSVDSELSADTPRQAWAAIRDSVISDIKATLTGGAEGPILEHITSEAQTNGVAVKMRFIAENPDVLFFSRTRQERSKKLFFDYNDPQGFDTLQFNGKTEDKYISITVTRTAISDINLGSLIRTPGEIGFTYIDITDTLDIGQPVDKRNFGIYTTQVLTRVFKRYRFRSGSSIKIRTPVTN